jgi:hypothetical protein
VLPFLEYDLHRQLMLRMRVLGMNAVFSLKSQIQVRPPPFFARHTAVASLARPNVVFAAQPPKPPAQSTAHQLHAHAPTQVGSSLIVGTLSGTAMFVSALPPLQPLAIQRTIAVKVGVWACVCGPVAMYTCVCPPWSAAGS